MSQDKKMQFRNAWPCRVLDEHSSWLKGFIPIRATPPTLTLTPQQKWPLCCVMTSETARVLR
jgi:hypothetical protein